jgi:hypothetical protein
MAVTRPSKYTTPLKSEFSTATNSRKAVTNTGADRNAARFTSRSEDRRTTAPPTKAEEVRISPSRRVNSAASVGNTVVAVVDLTSGSDSGLGSDPGPGLEDTFSSVRSGMFPARFTLSTWRGLHTGSPKTHGRLSKSNESFPEYYLGEFPIIAGRCLPVHQP